ncbi:MAG: hypothetical protein LBR12_03865, partial [Opitutaceae bacterium]|nr:hypothetical protein [Opitutaceae bacterium]
MELNLPPIATTCRLSGTPFAKGDRVVSALVDNGPDGGVARLDMLEAEAGQFAPDGRVVCRWTQVFKPREPGENPERALKLTAENLFLALM